LDVKIDFVALPNEQIDGDYTKQQQSHIKVVVEVYRAVQNLQ